MARQHDETYKLIFSHPGAVEDLVRSFVGKDLAEEFDFETLEPLPTDRISEELVRRQLDLLWKIRFRRKWLYVLIHIEFQSEVDPFMALRVLTYVCLSYEDLIRRGEVKAGDKLPPILPVVIYNGRAPWRAATDISELIAPVPAPLRRYLPRAGHVVFDLQRIGEWDGTPKNLATSLGRVERAPSADNVRRFMRNQADRFPGPGFAELRKALLTWVAGAGEAWQISRKELARIRSLTEDETMWERVKEMREQIHREGLEQGRRAEGRALVGRLATRKFGARTAERLSRVVEGMADPERLAEVADAIMDCDSDAELFARVGM